MKTKYDINQVPEEVLKRLGQAILTQFQHKGAYPYGCFEINVNATELVEAAKVKQRTTAEVDKEIVEVIRSYVSNYCSGIRPAQSLSYTAYVPGTQQSFPKKIADLLEERESIQAEAF